MKKIIQYFLTGRGESNLLALLFVEPLPRRLIANYPGYPTRWDAEAFLGEIEGITTPRATHGGTAETKKENYNG